MIAIIATNLKNEKKRAPTIKEQHFSYITFAQSSTLSTYLHTMASSKF
jgi:hypothetical protein